MTFLKKLWPWLLAILVISIIWYFWNQAQKAKAQTNLANQTNQNTGVVPPLGMDYVVSDDGVGYSDAII